MKPPTLDVLLGPNSRLDEVFDRLREQRFDHRHQGRPQLGSQEPSLVIRAIFAPRLPFLFKVAHQLPLSHPKQRPDLIAMANGDPPAMRLACAREKPPEQGFGQVVAMVSRQNESVRLLGRQLRENTLPRPPGGILERFALFFGLFEPEAADFDVVALRPRFHEAGVLVRLGPPPAVIDVHELDLFAGDHPAAVFYEEMSQSQGVGAEIGRASCRERVFKDV